MLNLSSNSIIYSTRPVLRADLFSKDSLLISIMEVAPNNFELLKTRLDGDITSTKLLVAILEKTEEAWPSELKDAMTDMTAKETSILIEGIANENREVKN